MNPVMLLGILLALSVAGNAWQYHEHDKAVAAVATATQLNADTAAAAQTCTNSVDTLAKDSRFRQGRIRADVAALAPQISALQTQGNQALQAKPDNPTDLCGSLERFWRARIIEERSGTAGKGAK